MDCGKIKISKVIGLYILTAIIIAILQMTVLDRVFEPTPSRELGSILSVLLTYLLLMRYILRVTTTSFRDIKGLIKKVKRKEIVIITAIGILLAVFSVNSYLLVLSILSKIQPAIFISMSSDLLLEESSQSILLTGGFVILAVCIAPVIEEIIFRWAIYNRFKLRYSKKISILLVSLLFMIGHIGGNVIGSFILSIIGCILYDKSHNLLLPIGIHLVNNFIASMGKIGEFFSTTTTTQEELVAEIGTLPLMLEQSFYWICLIEIITIIGIIAFVKKNFNQDKKIRL